MPDLFLDTRPPERRSDVNVEALLSWSDRIRTKTWETPEFRLVLTWAPPDSLWAPCTLPDGGIAAVAGFLALDEAEWSTAEREVLPGLEGGLAGRAVWQRFRSDDTRAWDDLSGNAVIVLYDAASRRVHLRSDPAGCFPLYGCCQDGFWVWASHPDVLASATGRVERIDPVSLAEFVMASTVTPPHTYYEGIHLCSPGTVFTWDTRARTLSDRTYFRLEYRPEPAATEDDLASALAEAWRRAVQRRTLPRLGRVAVALSGGLDSRLVLACLSDPRNAFAFTCYDVPNREFRMARAIARAADVEFLPLQRSRDYYGDHAPVGVRISGGMGTFANNHFLGVLDSLEQKDAGILLTGCYCDYLFKGLPLNRRIRVWDGRETLASFDHEFYFTRWRFHTPLAHEAEQRWEQRIPPALRQGFDDAALFRIETLRTFPLCYEGDNEQRLVPQRLLAWSPPVTDLEVLRIYQRTPWRWKLNRKLFLNTARRLLADSPLLAVPDANTGARLDAPAWQEALSWQWLRLCRKIRAWRTSLASDGSWPNWRFYYRHSPALERHWSVPTPELEGLFLKVTGWRELPRRPADFPVDQCFLFVAMLTLKLWWRHRACSVGFSN
ncbi:asparagine synthase-related protein [Limisphaera sp. VF-2]|uniref:asparagine synthase-related protein n=1 Tax=Limisphaera sp. VF-2 TaxID=3400418 RepID=UPI003C269315